MIDDGGKNCLESKVMKKNGNLVGLQIQCDIELWMKGYWKSAIRNWDKEIFIRCAKWDRARESMITSSFAGIADECHLQEYNSKCMSWETVWTVNQKSPHLSLENAICLSTHLFVFTTRFVGYKSNEVSVNHVIKIKKTIATGHRTEYGGKEGAMDTWRRINQEVNQTILKKKTSAWVTIDPELTNDWRVWKNTRKRVCICRRAENLM